MSSSALFAARAVRGITGPQKCVLMLLADHANGEDVAWPSKKTLSEESCLSIRCVRECLQALEEAGLLKRTNHWRKDGSQATDEITLTLPPPPARGAAPPRHHSVKPPAPRAPLEARLNQEDRSTTRERACSLFDEEDQPPAECPSRADEFLAFWQTYPRKVGRGAAEKAFQRAKPPGIAVLKAAISRQTNSKQWQEGFVPNPATWLNQKRWEDEVEDARREVWD